MHMYIYQRFNLESITINLKVMETVFPEGIVAIAQIAEARPKEQIC